MAIYKKCSKCGKRIEQYNECECMAQAKKESYKRYKERRLMDKAEKERQDFYSSSAWIRLSDSIKRHFMGMCVICWLRDKIENGIYCHHIVEVSENYNLRLCEDNLITLCSSCHSRVHSEYNKGDKQKEHMQKILVDAVIKFDSEYY